jgi:hypothetical protein
VKYVAIRNHIPEVADVLNLFDGDKLSYERRNSIYPGWIWCIDSKGLQAWVPEAFVTIEGSSCRMIRDYISRELVAEEGDIVEMIELESGWGWAISDTNESGWIPMECLERLIPQDFSG